MEAFPCDSLQRAHYTSPKPGSGPYPYWVAFGREARKQNHSKFYPFLPQEQRQSNFLGLGEILVSFCDTLVTAQDLLT